jgi:hypothetical protein
MTVSAATDPTSTQGSRGDVPYRKLARALEANSAAPSPAPVPKAATRAFSRKTIAITRVRWALAPCRVAPIASRVASSRSLAAPRAINRARQVKAR